MKTHELQPDPEDLRRNRTLAAASYVWILFALGLALSGKSPFARYHARQGALVFVFWLLNILVTRLMNPQLQGLDQLLSLIMFAAMAYGIVQAMKGRYRPLPLIGWLVCPRS